MDRNKGLAQCLQHLGDGVADKGRGVVLHEVCEAGRKPLRELGKRSLHSHVVCQCRRLKRRLAIFLAFLGATAHIDVESLCNFYPWVRFAQLPLLSSCTGDKRLMRLLSLTSCT